MYCHVFPCLAQKPCDDLVACRADSLLQSMLGSNLSHWNHQKLSGTLQCEGTQRIVGAKESTKHLQRLEKRSCQRQNATTSVAQLPTERPEDFCHS